MDSVVHFEITCDDVDRARSFYQAVFDWNTQQMERLDYVFANTAETDDQGQITRTGAINGGMFKREGSFKTPIIVMNVDSIEEAFTKIKANDGAIVKKKEPVGNMGYTGYFKDTEGNLLGLWEAH